MLTIAILSLSFFTVLTGAVLAPALPSIGASFPGVGDFWLQSLMTIPALVFLLMLPLLRRWPWRKKTQVLVGLSVYLIGGCLPLLALPFIGLLGARVLSGVGMSLFAGPAVSLIGDYFPAAERAKLLGWASAVTSIGAITAVLAGGVLAAHNWHWVFGLYALALVPLILIAWFVPTRPTPGKTVTAALPRAVWPLYALIILWNGLYFVLPTTLPFYLPSVLHDPVAAHSGMVLAAISTVGFLVGVWYARIPISVRLKTVLCFAVLATAAILLLLGSWLALALAVVAAGIGVGMAMPLFNERLVAASTPVSRDHVLTVGASMLFLGQFLSPFVFSGLSVTWRLGLMFLVAAVLEVGTGLNHAA